MPADPCELVSIVDRLPLPRRRGVPVSLERSLCPIDSAAPPLAGGGGGGAGGGGGGGGDATGLGNLITGAGGGGGTLGRRGAMITLLSVYFCTVELKLKRIHRVLLLHSQLE